MDRSLKTLADFTSPALMVPNLNCTTPAAVITELCGVLQREAHLSDSEAFCEAVITRELISPTSISPGFAMPHARLAGLPQLSFALARSSQPFVWFGDSSVRVQIVFLFAVPEADAKTYLNVISAVARLSENTELVGQLIRAPDAKTMFEVLEHAPLRRWPLQNVSLNVPNLEAAQAVDLKN
jgi:mannitol/fructose-specific phosphotransferase system IIA component (Ntr-type)